MKFQWRVSWRSPNSFYWPIRVSKSQAENHSPPPLPHTFPLHDKTTAAFTREERRQSVSDIDPAFEPNNEIRTKWNGVCEWTDSLGTKRQSAVTKKCGLLRPASNTKSAKNRTQPAKHVTKSPTNAYHHECDKHWAPTNLEFTECDRSYKEHQPVRSTAYKQLLPCLYPNISGAHSYVVFSWWVAPRNSVVTDRTNR